MFARTLNSFLIESKKLKLFQRRTFHSLQILKITVIALLVLSIVTPLIFYIRSDEMNFPLRNNYLLIEELMDLNANDGKNVFFIESSQMKQHKKPRKMTLTARQACAIESAAIMNPHLKIFVLVTAHFKIKYIPRTTEITNLKTFENVQFKFLNMTKLARDSPMEDFIDSGALLNSSFITTHTSDVLRLLILWKYGGTYLDLDMIVRKRLDIFPSNYACADVPSAMNGAIINFDLHDGRRLVEIFMSDLVLNYKSKEWGTQGPMLLTRVLQKLCNVNSTHEMAAKENCDGFHVLPYHQCYPITGVVWNELFNETSANGAMSKVKDAMVIHFWNKLSKVLQLNTTNSISAYVQLAKQHCPMTISSCGIYF